MNIKQTQDLDIMRIVFNTQRSIAFNLDSVVNKKSP